MALLLLLFVPFSCMCSLYPVPSAVWSADDWYKNTLVEGDDTAKLAEDELEPAENLDPVVSN